MQNISSMQGLDGRALGVAIIEDLIASGLSVSAMNYEVWLAYRTGAVAGLAAFIDEARAARVLTQHVLDSLYETHFASTRFSVQMLETGDGIARELAEVLECLRTAGERTRSYGDTLSAAERLDANEVDPALFARRVRELVNATRHMAAHHQQMSAQIVQSAHQVESLQAALTTVRIEALSDALTGLGNRRHFEAALNKLVGECANAGAPLSLVLCDIDHFKRINDTWGHPVGDQVIKYVAYMLNRIAPKDALVARHGGEEFAIILPRMNRICAVEIAEAARQAIRAQRMTKRSTGQLIGAVTVSFGVAELRGNEQSKAILERADQHLYAAKTNGRDQVSCDAPAQAAA